jgi:Cys-tRNA(Pro)/Cys-tRNA(Cys) deacylase
MGTDFVLEINEKLSYNTCGDNMATKTNAVRLVEQAHIPCREAFYEYDENDLRGTHAAHAIGMPEEQVFKTLVTRSTKSVIHVFCIPVCFELDLKKAAKAVGEKSVELISVKELLPLTGYIRGGCSPVGMKKQYPTHFDETAQLYEEIAVSAGARGHQMIVPPDMLVQLVNGDYLDLIQ